MDILKLIAWYRLQITISILFPFLLIWGIFLS